MKHHPHRRLHHSVIKLLLPILSTAVFYAVFYLFSAWQFDVLIIPQVVPFDYLLQLGLAYVLITLSKRLWVFVVLQGLLMAVLYVGNAVKMAFFGGPIMPDDIYALRSLLLILEGWQFFAAAAPLAAIAALLLFNLTLRHWSAYLSLLLLILLGMTLRYQPGTLLEPLDERFGNSVWDQRSNYLTRGAALYTLQEGARFFAMAEVPPDRDLALSAAANLQAAVPSKPVTNAEFAPRNLHIILLESFWDPSTLKKARFSQAPLTSEFRTLWRRAGNAHALSPVFGGYTANSEFEMLCGFPVVQDNVKFERQLLNNVPCLPHILGEAGYRTIASHPNVPVFWNRVNAYQRIGFQTYWSQPDFQLDDMNREFLADASLYRQVLDKLGPTLATKQPVLNYIVTYFGHWNYPLGGSRPSKITSKSAVEDVTTYANTVYYKTKETMAFLKELRQRDPDGIIVLFGDHLPFLGWDFAGYVESGTLSAQRNEFTPEMFRYYVSTPLIIIDGKRGPLKTGDLPIYQIPALLLKLLNYSEPTILDYTRPPAGMQVRPLPGMHFNVLANGTIDVCKEPPYTPSCEVSSRWLKDVLIVNNDLFIGLQFTRQSYQKPPQPDTAAQTADRPAAPDGSQPPAAGAPHTKPTP